MKIIIDTSSIIAMLLAKNSENNMYRIAQELKQKKYQLVTCLEAFLELRTAIASTKFKSAPTYKNRKVSQFINHYKHFAYYYSISSVQIDVSIRDHTDKKFLQLALASNADYLITGDKDLMEVKAIGKTKIYKPAEFIKDRES
jgi:putative PIN family toxin of toxin-antitoxin system